MSAAGVGGHTDCGRRRIDGEIKAKENEREKGERERERNKARTDSGIFLLISNARLAVVESRLSIFNAIMSRRV